VEKFNGKNNFELWKLKEDEVLFNIIEEETTTGLWNRLESLYMTKSLKNKIFLKR
jgi:hypothetical protein